MKSAMAMRAFLALSLFVLALTSMAGAGTINVLWYTGGVEANSPGQYQSAVNYLAANNGTNTWNVTFWDSGSMPTGTFNVLVIASPQGGWGSYPDYTAINAAAPGITWGNRLMLTGQDADWHDINGPGPSPFDGPFGFLADSINWAGSGTGMGLVALGQDAGGFCEGSQLGLTGFSVASCSGTNSVIIPNAFTSFPINTGLSSAGLSNWDTSAHEIFTNLSSQWTGINVDGNVCDANGNNLAGGPCNNFVTIVTEGGGGGITPGGQVPEPGSLALLGSGVLGLAGMIRRKFNL